MRTEYHSEDFKMNTAISDLHPLAMLKGTSPMNNTMDRDSGFCSEEDFDSHLSSPPGTPPYKSDVTTDRQDHYSSDAPDLKKATLAVSLRNKRKYDEETLPISSDSINVDKIVAFDHNQPIKKRFIAAFSGSNVLNGLKEDASYDMFGKPRSSTAMTQVDEKSTAISEVSDSTVSRKSPESIKSPLSIKSEVSIKSEIESTESVSIKSDVKSTVEESLKSIKSEVSIKSIKSEVSIKSELESTESVRSEVSKVSDSTVSIKSDVKSTVEESLKSIKSEVSIKSELESTESVRSEVSNSILEESPVSKSTVYSTVKSEVFERPLVESAVSESRAELESRIKTEIESTVSESVQLKSTLAESAVLKSPAYAIVKSETAELTESIESSTVSELSVSGSTANNPAYIYERHPGVTTLHRTFSESRNQRKYHQQQYKRQYHMQNQYKNQTSYQQHLYQQQKLNYEQQCPRQLSDSTLQREDQQHPLALVSSLSPTSLYQQHKQRYQNQQNHLQTSNQQNHSNPHLNQQNSITHTNQHLSLPYSKQNSSDITHSSLGQQPNQQNHIPKQQNSNLCHYNQQKQLPKQQNQRSHQQTNPNDYVNPNKPNFLQTDQQNPEPSHSNHQQNSRNYKHMTRERRMEANARERTRVHTISAAFDRLRKTIPSYSHQQKLSKLSVLRVACSYIMTLSKINRSLVSTDNVSVSTDVSVDSTDISADYSLADCVDLVSRTIQTEGKLMRKKKDD